MESKEIQISCVIMLTVYPESKPVRRGTLRVKRFSSRVIKVKSNASSCYCEPSESLLIHCYRDSVSQSHFIHPRCLFLGTFPCTENVIHLLVSLSASPRGRDLLDFPVASLSLPLIAAGITGRQGQNGLQRLWFHRCFPNWLFSSCARSPSTPKFPHLLPSHPTPRLGNGIKNKRFSPKIDTHFQEEAGLTLSLLSG